MPQQIDVPGMGVVEFPDGMSDQQMAAAIQANMPKPATVGGVAAQGGIGGVKAALGAPSAAIPALGALEHGAEGLRAGGVAGAKALGIPVPEALDKPLPTVASATQAAIEKVTGPFRKAQNLPERLAETGGEFAVGAAAGPGGILRSGARALGSVIPAMASQGAAEIPGVAGTKYEQIARLLGAVGGIGAQGAGRMIASPVTSNIRARVDPAGYGGSQVARMVDDSRIAPGAAAAEVGTAAAEGQPMFTVADALGNAGQRGLSTVARAPGQGRTDVVNFLEGRQGGQGGRVANALAEGFDAPQTAEQTRARLTTARDTAADVGYEAVRQGAGPVDLTHAVAKIDSTLSPGVNQVARRRTNIADDSVESALQSVRDRLTDDRSMLTDFNAVQRARGDLADKIKKAERAGEGNKARLLGQVLREMDTAMESASAGYKAQNKKFSGESKAIDALDEGKTAAQRGRSEDVVRDYQGRTVDQQGTFRTGYADKLIEDTQQPFGVNKARPLTSDAFGAEAAAMSPNAPQLMRRLGRENTMFETRRQATGGSQTADNLADAAGAGLDPALVANAIMGNHRGVARGLLNAGTNMLTGNTPAVRAEIARILLMRGDTATPAHIRQTLEELHRAEIARQIHRRVGQVAPLVVAGEQNGP